MPNASSGPVVQHSYFPRISSFRWKADGDVEAGGQQQPMSKRAYFLTLSVRAFSTLGVIYGDIGTSPLYTVATIFATPGIDTTPDNLLGVLSAIIWSITILVILKYGLVVLRADDNGNGGPLALFANLRRAAGLEAGLSGPVKEEGVEVKKAGGDLRVRVQRSEWYRRLIILLVVLGLGTLLGDGVLTPSMSVISAVEGLKLKANISTGVVDGISIAIFVLLFGIQGFGTHKLAFSFSPIVMTWFAFNFGNGVYNLVKYDPSVLRGLSPHYAVKYFFNNGVAGWKSLSSILLAFTGCEALFADIGHFDRPSIQMSLLSTVFPALIITYSGQISYLSKYPENVSNAFFSSLPPGTFWPMFVVATVTTVVASQALISAVFSIISQAIAQGFFPAFRIRHTSSKHIGQVYVPFINWLLLVLCCIVVAGFKKSSALGQAYGLTVNIDMMVTSVFVSLIMWLVWGKPLLLAMCWGGGVLFVEGVFLSSNLLKVPHGGWLSLTMSVIWSSTMFMWFYGTDQKRKFYKRTEVQLQDLIRVKMAPGSPPNTLSESYYLGDSDEHLYRTGGVAIFATETLSGLPLMCVEYVNKCRVLPELMILLTNRTVSQPLLNPSQRFLIRGLKIPGCYHIVARYGYMEHIVQDESFVTSMLGELRAQLAEALHSHMVGLQGETQSCSDPSSSLPALLPLAAPASSSAMSGALGSAVRRTTSGAKLLDDTASRLGGPADVEMSHLGKVPEDSPGAPLPFHHLKHVVLASLSAPPVYVGVQSPPPLDPRAAPLTHWPFEGMEAFSNGMSSRGSRQLPGPDALPTIASSKALLLNSSASLLTNGAGVGAAAGLDDGQGLQAAAGMEVSSLKEEHLRRELLRLQKASGRVFFVFGDVFIKVAVPSGVGIGARLSACLRWLVLEVGYQMLHRNLASKGYERFGVPLDNFMEVGVVAQL